MIVGYGSFSKAILYESNGTKVIIKRYYIKDDITSSTIEYNNRMMLGDKHIEGIITFHKKVKNDIYMDYYDNNLEKMTTVIDNKIDRIYLVKQILPHLITGLQTLYDNYMCHADIAPKNIFISSFVSVIGDLGSMIGINKNNDGYFFLHVDEKTDKKLKKIYNPHSTYIYASPETRKFKTKYKYTRTSDIYSLGISLIKFILDSTDELLETIREKTELIDGLINDPISNILKHMICEDHRNRIIPNDILALISEKSYL